MEIRRILERLGYKDLIDDAWYKRIADWQKWYKGKTAFHNYTIYNGQTDVACKRKSLGMAKKVCEDKADLLLNERVEITIADNESMQSFLDDALQANNFWVKGNQLVEKANAFGTGAFVEYKDGDKICIDYVLAGNIYPLSWYNGEITECAFASNFNVGKEGDRTYINRHVLENGKYVVYNNLYDEAGKEVPLPEGVLAVWNTGRESPLFQIITPNIVNNIDLANPMGISVYANNLDVLETIDLIYDSYHNEFKLGKKRIFVDDSLIKPNLKDGTIIPVFDMNDTTFYGIPGKDNDKAITESNMELRTEEHQTGLQSSLDLLSEQVGFGKGYYKFDVDNVQTATAVISQNSKLFRKIKKDEIILEKALIDMVRTILYLGGYSDDADISISFDDSIIEDTDAIARRCLLEYQAGIIDDVMYFEKVYDHSKEAAEDIVEVIRSRRPAEALPPGEE